MNHNIVLRRFRQIHMNIILANCIVLDSSCELTSCGKFSGQNEKIVDHLLILNKLGERLKNELTLYSKNHCRETSQRNSRFLSNPKTLYRAQQCPLMVSNPSPVNSVRTDTHIFNRSLPFNIFFQFTPPVFANYIFNNNFGCLFINIQY